MTATDRLRAMLDERGVEYTTQGEETFFIVDRTKYCSVWAINDRDLCASAAYITPEQAIAATLRSNAKPCYAADANYERCKYSVNRGWCDDVPFLVWNDTSHLFITVGGLKTWDVTDDAKKWFATLGAGTCRMDVLDTGNEAAYEHYEYIMHCANCHHEFGYVQYNEDGDTWMDDKPRFCPNCGRRVES